MDGGLGVDGGWLPLPTRPQQYCDPDTSQLLGTNDAYSFCKLVLCILVMHTCVYKKENNFIKDPRLKKISFQLWRA